MLNNSINLIQMKKQLFLSLIFVAFFGYADAQKVSREQKEKEKLAQSAKEKPGVLVVGNGNAAVAAALQSANSGVYTTILLQAGGFDIVSPLGDLSSGIQAKFVKQYEKEGGKGAFDKLKANAILKSITDTTKNLNVVRNVMWTKASRSGNHWSFKLSDGSSVRPEVLINPGDKKLNAALEIEPPSPTPWNKLDYNNNSYRTNVAVGKLIDGATTNVFSMYQLLVPKQENLVWISDVNSMEIGQAAGATAAYTAFFKSKTSLSNLKKIQGELIAFKLNLMPFSDIETTDSAWKSIQLVGVTGIIKGDLDGKTLRFMPDQLVTTQEIKQPIKDFYYKAQIWFDDYKDPKMTIRSTLDMIAYVGNKSLEAIKKDLPKKWKTTYRLKSELDYDRQVNRREFALLLQDYMPPFNVNLDDKGKVVR